VRLTGLLVLGGLLVVIAAACGGGGDGGYPESARSAFMASCLASAASTSGGNADPDATQGFCECTFAEMQERFSYDEFKRVDTATLAGTGLSEDDQEKVVAAIADCRP
jgi:hypothetical protein